MTLTGIESNYEKRPRALARDHATETSREEDRGASGTYAERLEKVLSLYIDIKLAALRVLSEVKGGHLGNVLILALTLLLLELERNASDRTPLNALHQVRGKTSDL